MALFRRKSKVSKEDKLDLIFSSLVGSTPIVLYNFDQEDFVKKGYSENSEIYSIIKKITDKCNVSTPYVYIDKEGVKAKRYNPALIKSKDSIQNIAKRRLEIHKALEYDRVDSDLSLLLKNPNPNQTWREFITLFRVFYFVQGEAFIYREAGNNNCALALYIVPAHRMNAIISEGNIVGWRLDMLNGRVRTFNTIDVMHLKMPNPNFDFKFSQLRGMSPLLAGLKYLQLDDAGVESWIKSLENEGAKGIISPNHNNIDLWLTEEQVKETQAAIQEKIHGMDNRNKITVSGMPLQYTHIGLSPEALHIIEGLRYSGVKLCDLWGVPAILFDPNPTYQNQKEARKRFVNDVILPYLNAEEDKLNSWLVKPFIDRDGKNYLIDYDLSAFEELRLDLSDVEAMLKTHTINEVRVMLGSDELDNEYANEVFIPQGMVPLSDFSVEV